MKIIKKLLKYTAIFIALLVVYLFVVTIMSFITINDEMADEQKDIPIYILSNGVHTDIVLPIKNQHYNWLTQFNFEHTKSKDTTFQFVALGWGDKGFYLETPTWSDLKVSTALKAVSGLSSSAMHVTFYKKMEEDKFCKKNHYFC